MRDLGAVNGDGCSSALISNSSSEVVGFSEDCAFQTVHEFYVKGNGPMVDIESLIVVGPEVTAIQPVDISEIGESFELAAFAKPRTTDKGLARTAFRLCQRVPRLPQKSGAVPGAYADLQTCQGTASRRRFWRDWK
jgi:hypothetical protein